MINFYSWANCEYCLVFYDDDNKSTWTWTWVYVLAHRTHSTWIIMPGVCNAVNNNILLYIWMAFISGLCTKYIDNLHMWLMIVMYILYQIHCIEATWLQIWAVQTWKDIGMLGRMYSWENLFWRQFHCSQSNNHLSLAHPCRRWQLCLTPSRFVDTISTKKWHTIACGFSLSCGHQLCQ